jgi:ribosomal protein L29
MGMTTYLQIFLLADVFLTGIICAVLVQIILSRLRHQHDESPARLHQSINIQIPEAMKRQLLQESQANFQVAMHSATTNLERDLISTAGLLDKLVKRLGTEIVGDELERYRVELMNLRQQAQKQMANTNKEVETYRRQVAEKIKLELESEKQQLLTQIDTKLADAFASFLVEALQHNIDLGAQETYLKTLLEEHKQELKREITNESVTSK